jgi:hypothetical protein
MHKRSITLHKGNVERGESNLFLRRVGQAISRTA